MYVLLYMKDDNDLRFPNTVFKLLKVGNWKNMQP